MGEIYKLNKEFENMEKMKLLSDLEIRGIKDTEFDDAIKILDEELGKDRVRGKVFLHEKFKENPEFFIGIFLNKEMIGAIFGFPRESYLLISELVVLSRFQSRGFGKKLVEKFENIAKEKYSQINAGADDKSIYFYESIGYKPFLLIQFKKGDYSKKDFKSFKIIREYEYNKDNMAIETKINKADLKVLNQLRKKYQKAWFQYIFVKTF